MATNTVYITIIDSETIPLPEHLISVHSSFKGAVLHIYRTLMKQEPLYIDDDLVYEMYEKIKSKFKYQFSVNIQEHNIDPKCDDDDKWSTSAFDIEYDEDYEDNEKEEEVEDEDEEEEEEEEEEDEEDEEEEEEEEEDYDQEEEEDEEEDSDWGDEDDYDLKFSHII